MVQGRFNDGQVRASYLVDQNGAIAAVGPRGPRPIGPEGPNPHEPGRDGPPPPGCVPPPSAHETVPSAAARPQG
jgi:hypothetical protein